MDSSDKQIDQALVERAHKPHYLYLSEEQYAQLLQYKHFAPKTPYEEFMLNRVTIHIERSCMPQWWTANTFTILGNTMLFVAGGLCMYFGGLSYTLNEDGSEKADDEYLPKWCFYFSAFAVQWFSWWDMMDGQRARRLKCGTPIGRIVDEAGDGIQYAWVAMIMGYVMKMEPGWLCLSFGLINLPMYSMETKFIFTGKLSITAGGDGLGPVEIELLFFLVFLTCGIFGVSGLGKPVADLVGDWLSDQFLWKHLLAVVFILLLSLFTIENLIDSFKINFKQTSIYMANPVLTILNAALAGFLGLYTFTNEFVVFFLLHQMAFCISSYRLMIHNMTKKAFRIFGIEHLFVVLPTLVHCTKYVEAIDVSGAERYVTYVCTCSLYILFYTHMYLLAQQYLARNPERNFWVIKKPKADMS
mmetsp:Transcript_9364/g.15801  ORF Transcript_9364/g.15801 Transcript_9364/m.15801 type:complete len:415 (+) Transcript_9364:39-1283(+)